MRDNLIDLAGKPSISSDNKAAGHSVPVTIPNGNGTDFKGTTVGGFGGAKLQEFRLFSPHQFGWFSV